MCLRQLPRKISIFPRLVLNELDQQATELEHHWQLRIERARYEAERAFRQFDAVEPENRLVARTLERRWNEKLQQ